MQPQAVEQLDDIRQHAIVGKQEDSEWLGHLSSKKFLSSIRVVPPGSRHSAITGRRATLAARSEIKVALTSLPGGGSGFDPYSSAHW
jgi:hypothetical protein